MDADLHLANFDNWQLGLINIVNTYLEKNIDVDNRLFNFKKYINNSANIKIKQKINIILNDHKAKTETWYNDQKRVVSILNEIKFYTWFLSSLGNYF